MRWRDGPPQRSGGGGRLTAPAAARNRGSILEALRDALPDIGTVLEIGSGTGVHAATFAAALKGLLWQPTDIDPEQLDSIAAWVGESAAPNLAPPLRLDAADWPWPIDRADVVFSANVIHIAPWPVALGLLRGAGLVLGGGGVLCLYGPFTRRGRPLAAGNLRFDAALKAADPDWGIRNLDTVADEAMQHGLTLERIVDMPADNLTVFFRRG